jgi:hypothetical protein
MLTPELELAAAIYILYVADCVHWLKSGQSAVTRRITGTWRLHEHSESSYTLLGWMPVMVNPFDLRPSFAMVSPEALTDASNQPAEELLRREFPTIHSLTILSVIGSLNLLGMFPAFLIMGFFPIPWSVPVTIAASVQIALGVVVFIQCGKWRRVDPVGFWRQYIPLLLNPMAALRSGDVMLKSASEREQWGRRPANQGSSPPV